MKSIYTPSYKKMLKSLRSAREAEDLSQTQLARLLQKPQSFVSKVESGHRRLDVREFVEWTAVLGVKPDELIRTLADDMSTPIGSVIRRKRRITLVE